MKKAIFILSLLLCISSEAQSVLQTVDKKLENLSKPFTFATIYGEDFADLIINGAVDEPESVSLLKTEVLSGMVIATYSSVKYKFVVHIPENTDSVSFVRIYNK
jgi:hypothetical protein